MQVSIEVMFVWTRSDGRTECGNFEIQWLTIGYEPNCRCGADCSDRPCVHLLAFFMVRTSVDPDFDLMWQVALVEVELQEMLQHLQGTRGLLVDATGGEQLRVLKEAEEIMIRNAGLMRSCAPEYRGEAIGQQLKEIARRAETAQRLGTAILAPKMMKTNALVKLAGARGNASSQRDFESLQPLTIQISSISPSPSPCRPPQKKRIADEISPSKTSTPGKRISSYENSRSPDPRKFKRMRDEISPSVNRPKKQPMYMSPSIDSPNSKQGLASKSGRKTPVARSNVQFPIGEARIYRNWHVRKCFGKDCGNTIETNEFFVNIPLMNMNPRTALIAYHNVGLCLRSEGRCLKHPTTQIAHIMKQEKFYIPHKLPVFQRGLQIINEDDVQCITCCLGGRQAYLSQ